MRVSVFAALVVPTATLPKFRFAGLKETGVTPVPLRFIRCGEPAALSLTVISPGILPETDGVKTTDTLQVLAG
jgi:hypothetical protein